MDNEFANDDEETIHEWIMSSQTMKKRRFMSQNF
jgi:hypothetical protein